MTTHPLVVQTLLHVLGAAAVASLATRQLRRIALRHDLLDQPNSRLKVQAEATPYLGGIAVWLGWISLSAVANPPTADALTMAVAATAMLILGLIDDLRPIAAWVKLLVQAAVAVAVVWLGQGIELAFLPNWAAALLSVIWIVGITNAFNLVDVSDGLAATLASVAGLGLVIWSSYQGDVVGALYTSSLLGALLGFLRYNWAPARIYLGDAGSLSVGMILALLTLRGSYHSSHDLGWVGPVVLLTVPIGETVLVSFCRLAKGSNPLHGSPDHFAVRLRARHWSSARIASMAASVAALAACAAGAIVVSEWPLAAMLTGLWFAGSVAGLIWLARLPVRQR